MSLHSLHANNPAGPVPRRRKCDNMTGVIADSDDDSDRGDYSSLENIDIEQALKEQLLGSDGVGRETPSTDSVFFQCILKEQGDAARKQASMVNNTDNSVTVQELEPKGHLLDSSMPILHARPLADPDSSYYLPTQSANIAVLPSSIIAKDPYEIPSSPEKTAKTHTNPTPTTSQTTLRGRKRRQRGSDVPEGGQPDSDGKLMAVEPVHLTASQEQEYQSVEASSSSIGEAVVDLPAITRSCPIESSSLVTAVNTQHSQHAVQTEITVEPQRTPARERSTRKTVKKRKVKDKSTSPKSEPTTLDAAQPIITVLEDSEDEESYPLGDDEGVDQLPASSMKSDITPEVRRKGRSGRSKGATQTAVTNNDQTVKDTTRRKRGRPRKNVKQEVLDDKEDLAPANSNEEIDQKIDNEGKEEDKEVEQTKGEADGTDDTDVAAIDQSDEVAIKDVSPEIKPALKKPNPVKMESSTRPFYRVGLSKRSYIAPLLKSIRK